MSRHRQRVFQKNPYVFVLWGQNFDSVAATISITTFRRAGIKTKIVGIHGPSAAGQHGLMLRSDMLLSKALTLTHNTACILLPCDLGAARRLPDDPRFMQFLAAAASGGAQLIVQSPDIVVATDLAKIEISEHQWSFYPQDTEMIAFISTLATEISEQSTLA